MKFVNKYLCELAKVILLLTLFKTAGMLKSLVEISGTSL